MAKDTPYIIGQADTLILPGLVSQADTKLLITNPTIAAGDFKIWNPGGGGSWDNLATTPTAVSAAGTAVLISWSAAEAAYEPFTIVWQDSAGAQWCSGGVSIRMGTGSINTLLAGVNLTKIMGETLTGTAADVAASFSTFFNIHSATATVANITTLIGQLTGITSLANWLRGLARKDAMNATAKTELNSGGGNYDESTDSLEAIRDTEPLGTTMRGTDSALLATNYIVPATPTDITNAVTTIQGVGGPTLDALETDISNLPAATSTAVQNEVIEGTLTFRNVLRIIKSALAGLSTGGGTPNVAFRSDDDTKDRITATVDAQGNRTSISVDGS
jgi:hypothetical protein